MALTAPTAPVVSEPCTAVTPEPRAASSSWPACAECGSAGPFGVGKAVPLPAGPSHAVVPVVCRTCGDVRLFPADFVTAKP